MRDVLREIARAWREERPQLIGSAGEITQKLADIAAGARDGSQEAPGEAALASTVQQFKRDASTRGAAGSAMRRSFRGQASCSSCCASTRAPGDQIARDMVLATLWAMALGGMRDHIGGGFHRYSVDGNWRVPHFEKMLYDQAQLVLAYLEAAQVSGDPFYAQIAEDTLQYVAREMTAPEGGFYSAEDADSVPPEHAADAAARKMEGAFYIWPLAEVRDLLGEDSAAFERRYGLLPDGNAPFDPQSEFTGKNLLYTARGIADIATDLGREPGDVAAALTRARLALFNARSDAPASTSRRQDPRRLEWLDDRGLRPRRQRASRAAALSVRTPTTIPARVISAPRRAPRRSPATRCGTASAESCAAASAMARPRLTAMRKTTRA